MEIEIILYTTDTDKQPFVEWQDDLDRKTRLIVFSRLTRVRSGNFGNHKQLKGHKELWELIFDYGPGYRVYFAKEGSKVVILLCGGDKGSQDRDIQKAKRYWQDYKSRN